MANVVHVQQYADRCGVHRSTVLRNKALKEIINNNHIDQDHPAAKKYLKEKLAGKKKSDGGHAPTPPPRAWGSDSPATTRPTAEDTPDEPIDESDEQYQDNLGLIPENIRKLAHLPLNKLVYKFGTDVGFVKWLSALKEMEAIQEKRFKNQVTSGDYIPRDYVRNHVLSLFDTSYSRLVSDTPRTLTISVMEAVEAGKNEGEIELIVQNLISKQIQGVKENAIRLIRKAR